MLAGRSDFVIEAMVNMVSGYNSAASYLYHERGVGEDIVRVATEHPGYLRFEVRNEVSFITFQWGGAGSGWTHIMCRYSATLGLVSIWVNGAQVTGTAYASGLLKPVKESLNTALFNHVVDLDKGFRSDIQYIRFYGQALNNTELTDLYENGNDDGSKYGCFSGWDFRTLTEPLANPLVLPNIINGQKAMTVSGVSGLGFLN